MTRGGLGPIVAALGGELYAGGRRACVPGIGHGPADRSLSLLLDGDRVVAHSFAGDDWRVALDELHARGLVDGEGRLRGSGSAGGVVRVSAAERTGVARALWEEAARLTAGSPAERYLRRRGVGGDLGDLADLRSHASAPVSVYRPSPHRRPALLAGVRDPGAELVAIEITYLTAAGRRAEHLALPRKTVGVVTPGAAVRLRPVGSELLVAEGLFTTLAAAVRFGLPGWALLSTSNLRRWRAPPGVRRVLIAGDRGHDGERSARILAAALRAQGVAAEVRLPPQGRGDWDDVQRAGG